MSAPPPAVRRTADVLLAVTIAHPSADRRSHAHNNVLQLAAEAGLTGLAGFGLLWAVVLLRGWAVIGAAPGPDARAVAAGAVGLLLCAGATGEADG